MFKHMKYHANISTITKSAELLIVGLLFENLKETSPTLSVSTLKSN